MPTFKPSVAAPMPGEPEPSLKPAHVVGLAPPVKIGLPLMFGAVAPEKRFLVLTAMVEPFDMLTSPTLLRNTVPLPARLPDLWSISKTPSDAPAVLCSTIEFR